MNFKEETILVENELRAISESFYKSSDEMIGDFELFFEKAISFLKSNTVIDDGKINYFFDTHIRGKNLKTANWGEIKEGIRKLRESIDKEET